VQPAFSLNVLIDRFIIMERRVSVEYIEDLVLKKKWTHTKITTLFLMGIDATAST
jgi:hypothetical protein